MESVMMRFVGAFLMTLMVQTAALAGPAEEANAMIDRWSAAYSANDQDLLVSFYTPDAILLGTTSPIVSQGTEAIRKYFEVLPNSGRRSAVTERHIIVLGDDAVIGTGFYTFSRAVNNDKPRPSRFTMLMVKRDGQWMIAHHHSSSRPDPQSQ
jgi:uncharacterized protein (TIGR02246 family)